MLSGRLDRDRLYNLLPAIYREQDAAEGYPLRALLRLVEGQAQILHGDIQQLWDNFFIETCEPWVIPYIADLVANNLLHDGSETEIDDVAPKLFPDLQDPHFHPSLSARRRADVAKTIYYRRRKGTLPMLEELARDVTGWAVHAAEFFTQLEWSQNLNYQSPERHECPNLRQIDHLRRLDGPFDMIAHSVDVRVPRQKEGWYNIPNIGFYLWRLQSYPLTNIFARQADPNERPWQFHFSPLGNPAPLFRRHRRGANESGLASELDLPGPIHCHLLDEDLKCNQHLSSQNQSSTKLYGPFDSSLDENNPFDYSFFIRCNGEAVTPAQIICKRLDPWPNNCPKGQLVEVDVEKGRLSIGDHWYNPKTVEVCFHYGFSADLGGGPYERRKWLIKSEKADVCLLVQNEGVPPVYPTLTKALKDWDNTKNTVIKILDSHTYELPQYIELSNDCCLVIEAANFERPLLKVQDSILEVRVSPSSLQNSKDPNAELTLSGIVLEGGLHVTGNLRGLRIIHSTLVPGHALSSEDGMPLTIKPSLKVARRPKPVGSMHTSGPKINDRLRVLIAFSIIGPIQIPEQAEGLWAYDSIIDGLGGIAIASPPPLQDPFLNETHSNLNLITEYTERSVKEKYSGPPATLERVTILGASNFRKLVFASTVIFNGPVQVSQRQEGCVRFCFVPPDQSSTPRRYQCQPDMEIQARLKEAGEEARAQQSILSFQDQEKIRKEVLNALSPDFAGTRYGLPNYAQLYWRCPEQILKGGENKSEIGAFNCLLQAQRESNLLIRMDEYLPFGLSPGSIYAT